MNNEANSYLPLDPRLADCMKRTIQFCRAATEDPTPFKLNTARMWLTNLEGWLPEQPLTPGESV
jgi:hypothetical protein